jgi:rhamnulokinase
MNGSARTRCLAVDMGASNVRIMLGEISGTGIETREIHRFPNQTIEKDGHERWDIEVIIRGIIGGLKRAVAEAGEDIASIGVDAWGVDFAMLDRAGKLLELPVAYRDGRTEGMEDKWLDMMSRKETFERSGINLYIFNTLFQLLSMKGSDELAGTSRILFLPSYVLHALGGRPVNELTISSTSQLLNATSGKWDSRILDLLGIRSHVLGEICPPGTVTGVLDHPELKMTGIRTIAVCAHDTASAVVAVPFGDDASVFISTGTWCLLGMETERPVLTSEALEEGFTNERGYAGTYRCLKNIVGLWLVQGLRKSLPVKDDYDHIESLARQYGQAPNIINPDDPLFYNPDDMKEAFDEYFRMTGQKPLSEPGGYFRCAYDSLIFSFRYHIEKLETLTGKAIRTIHLMGGGCQSRYLTSQTASICQRRVVSGPVEAATIGNLLVQSMSLGTLSSLEACRALVKNSMVVGTHDPDPPVADHQSAYLKYLEIKGQKAKNN